MRHAVITVGHSDKVFNTLKVKPKFSTRTLYTIKFFSAVTIIVVAGILLSLLGEKTVPTQTGFTFAKLGLLYYLIPL